MSAFSRKVAALTGVPEEGLERLAGGDLSEVLLIRRTDGHLSVAKGGPAVGTEAAMLRTIAGAGVAAPMVEGEYRDVLLIAHVENDGLFSPNAWADVGAAVRRLHSRMENPARYGWPTDYALDTVELVNSWRPEWPGFWGEQRLIPTAAILDRPWRNRIEALSMRLTDLLPDKPPASLLHGDLWTGNILVRDGRLAALIDPACCYGHAEVDLAMLTLFGAPPTEFGEAYGPLEPGWEERRSVYQLFPALVHLRLFGGGYAGLADRLLTALGA